MIINEISQVVDPNTQDASMARAQCYRIAKHAMKIHPLIKNDEQLEAWVGKKIDLASSYIESVYDYTMTEKKGLNDDHNDGKMRKSELFQIAKEAIELLEMIQPGDHIEGWVQKHINLAGDYLIAVYHYLDYKKLNPYQEEIDPAKLSHHSSVIQKNLDEILSKKTRTNDIDTKPGMMRILKKRVHEVEKEHAKENKKTNEGGMWDRKKKLDHMTPDQLDAYFQNIANTVKQGNGPNKDWTAKDYAIDQEWRYGYKYPQYSKHVKGNTHHFPKNFKYTRSSITQNAESTGVDEAGSRLPSSMAKTKAKLDHMTPDEIRAFFKNREDFAKQHAGGIVRPGYSAKELAQGQEFRYGREFAKGRPYSKHFESKMDEGVKDWLKGLAAAGIIVGSIAGVGSIENAMDNSVPVMQAMNKALIVANQKGDQRAAQEIKHDIDVAKISLDSGKNLNTVKHLQDQYAKYMPAAKFKESLHTNDSNKFGESYDSNMANGELVQIVKNGMRILDMVKNGRTLEDWEKAYITLANDYLDSVEEQVEVESTKPGSFKDRIIKKIAQPVKDYNKEKQQEPKKYESKLAEKLAILIK